MKDVKIGFIGLGEMGKPMAANLLKKQFAVTTCTHIRKDAVNELVKSGIQIADSPAGVARASDVIIIMARSTQQTEEIIIGKGSWEGIGIWQGIRPGSQIIICGTVNPNYCRNLAAAGKAKSIDVLDAPVSGGRSAAEAGTLTFMVGGEKTAGEKCRPVLEAMGKNIYFLGGPGTGQAMKLINNYMMIVNAFGTSEGILLGLKAGLDLKQMLAIINKSSGNSTIIENWDELSSHHKASSQKEAFEESIFYKDVALAVEYAAEMGVGVDLGRLVLKLGDAHLFQTDV